jgi:hypothetical protein
VIKAAQYARRICSILKQLIRTWSCWMTDGIPQATIRQGGVLARLLQASTCAVVIGF